MFLVALTTLALAALTHAQNSSDTTTSASASGSQSTTLATTSETSLLLPFYPPYPIASANSTTITSSASALASSSSSSSASASSGVDDGSTFVSDKYWQHTYRDYYASIITVLSTSTLVYAIDCAPNSAHPSYSRADFSSFAVCGAGVVGRGPITVTQGPQEWNFAVSQTEPKLNLTQSLFNQQSTSTRLDVTCSALDKEKKTCSNKAELVPESSTVSQIFSISNDGAEQERKSVVESLLENFSSMTEVLVTVTDGVDKLPKSLLSSMKSEATSIVSESPSAKPTATPTSSGAGATSDSTGAAPRVTGALSREMMFGAAGLMGVAIFGL